jgi:hypothetical protein
MRIFRAVAYKLREREVGVNSGEGQAKARLIIGLAAGHADGRINPCID